MRHANPYVKIATHNRMSVTVLCLLAVTCLGVRAQAKPLPEPPGPTDNAAVWYLTAQNELESAFHDQVQTITGNDAFPQDDASRAKAIEQIADPLEQIRRAAMLDHCRWAVDLKKDGPYTELPHLMLIRQHAKLLGAIAWHHGKKPGNEDLVIADALALIRLSRHAAADGTLIGCLVQYSIESDAYLMLGMHLNLFSRAQLEALSASLDALPPSRTVRDSVASEWLMVDWLRSYFVELGVKGLLQVAGQADGAGVAEALQDKDAETQRKLVEGWLTGLDEMYQQLADNLALPMDQFKKADAEFVKDLKATDNLLAAILIPALGSAYEREVHVTIERAALQAAIAFRLHGKSGFNTITDPVDGKPFSFVTTNLYLWVQSRQLNRHGKPVGMMLDLDSAKPLD